MLVAPCFWEDILSDLRFWRDVPDAVAAVGMSSGYLLLNKLLR